jgi:hypothetical protein
LWGRRLNGVCTDFENNGLVMDGLYDRIDIPLAWIDSRLYSRSWNNAVVDAAASYGYPIPDEAAEKAFSRLIQSEYIDFGLLNEKLQRQVLTRLITDPSAKKNLTEMNPLLENPGAAANRSASIEHNRQAVLAHYGLEPYRSRLLAIYDRVVRHRVCHCIDKTVVVAEFFNLERFPLVKWGRYEP